MCVLWAGGGTHTSASHCCHPNNTLQFFGYTKARHCFKAEQRAKRLTSAQRSGDNEWHTFSSTQVRLEVVLLVAFHMLLPATLPDRSNSNLVCGCVQKSLLTAFDAGARTEFFATWKARIPETAMRVRAVCLLGVGSTSHHALTLDGAQNDEIGTVLFLCHVHFATYLMRRDPSRGVSDPLVAAAMQGLQVSGPSGLCVCCGTACVTCV